jgi:hypothetical protein
MPKTLNKILLITGLVILFCAILILIHHFNFPPVEIVNFWLYKLLILLIPISIALVFINFIVRLFLPTQVWLKWISLFIIVSYLLLLLVIAISNRFNFSKREIIYLGIALLIALVFIVLIFFVKNRVITIITNGIVMLLIVLKAVVAMVIIIDEIDYEYDFYKDNHIAYVGFDSHKKVIVHQKKNSYNKRLRLINKNSGKLIRFSKKIELSDLNGIWLACNDDGIPIEKNSYYNGELLAKLPFVPEYAALVSNSDSLDVALSGDKSILMIDGILKVFSNIYITDKEDLIITSSGISEHSSIKSGVEGWNVIYLENCNGVSIKNMIFELNASPFQEQGIINIKNCRNINISNNFFVGKGKYLIYVDKLSEDITISNNRFENFEEFAICTEDPVVTNKDNEFYINHLEDEAKGLLIKSLELDNEDILRIIDYAQDDLYSGYFSGTNTIFGQEIFLGFKGGLYDLYFAAGLRNGIEKCSLEEFNIEEDCEYPYCGNLFTLVSKGISPFILNSDKSNDKWGWRSDADYREDKFLHINPNFISWIGSTIDIHPELNLPGRNITLGSLYDNTYKRTFRMFVETYLHMHYSDNFQLNMAIEEYKEVSDRDPYEFRGYLYQSFGHILTDYNIYEEEDEKLGYSDIEYNDEDEFENMEYQEMEFTDDVDGEYHQEEPEEEYYTFPFSKGYSNCYVSDCIGFWIRRKIDGSAESLFNLLAVNMMKFDEDWMREQYSKYGVNYKSE